MRNFTNCFLPSAYVDSYSGTPFACANSDGRYQLSAYPAGQRPENCVEIQLEWSTAA